MSEVMNETIYVWAAPNPFRMSDKSPEFNFYIRTAKGSPYQEDAFLVHQTPLIMQFDMPADVITPQVDALRAAQKEARVNSDMINKEFEEKIQSLLALPAPE